MRAPTRREFGIAAHLQQTTRADCIRDQSFIPIARIGTFFALVIETLERNAISESHEVLRDQTHRERMNRPLQFQKRGQHFIVRAEEILTAFLEAERAIHQFDLCAGALRKCAWNTQPVA